MGHGWDPNNMHELYALKDKTIEKKDEINFILTIILTIHRS